LVIKMWIIDEEWGERYRVKRSEFLDYVRELARKNPSAEWTLTINPADPGVGWLLGYSEKTGFRYSVDIVPMSSQDEEAIRDLGFVMFEVRRAW